MWRTYRKVAPQAIEIQKLFSQKGETLINDHVAFRTYNHKSIDLNVFEENLSRHHRYRAIKDYEWEREGKKLIGRHFEHCVDPATHPLIFVSQFQIESLHPQNQEIIHKMIDSVDAAYDPVRDQRFAVRERIWDPITVNEHASLSEESMIAAWIAAFGFVPSHFTLSINHFNQYSTLQSVNECLVRHGYELNESGGIIKGNEEVGLVWSNTMTDDVDVTFADGHKKIPGAYYEFAQRFVVEQGGEHILFRGFIADPM